jgi:hypothetical protein
MKVLALVVVGLVAFVVTAGASNFVSLGYSEETTIVGPGTDACATGVLIHNHDGSFENGFWWQYGGCAPPYYGAFGEAYDLGTGTIACGAYWLSDLPGGYYHEHRADCYVWEGGLSASPAAVLAVVTSVAMPTIPFWPVVGQNDVDLNIAVTGPFTIGYWGPWPGAGAWYFCAADQSGPVGHPWTCIAPGIGYPSGWQDPSVIEFWGPTSAMGCGVYFVQGTPVECETWGSVKALFR